jgi:glycosyltransferase involved in cell wall biosynthesis
MSARRTSHPPLPPWNVLHFASTFQTKTDTKWLAQIARYLDRRTFRLSAACFYDGGPVREQLESLGVATYDLDVRDERDLRAVFRARDLIRDIGCDVVHTHLLRADLFGGAAARWAGTPVILSTIYAVGQYRRAKRRRTDRLLDAACAILPTHAIAVSEAVKRDCVERLHMNPDRISVIRTGIDPPSPTAQEQIAALRAELGLDAGQRLVLTIARLNYEKGIDTLIEAAAALCQAHPEVRMVVLGEGPDRTELEARIRHRRLEGMIQLAGFRADVWPVVAAADLICIPSKSEGMPNALLEAMAGGKPIVATDVGGIPEVIVPEHNGLLVEPQDAEALSSAMARLIEDPALAQRLGSAARQTVEAGFLARDVVARYASLYRRLLEQRSPVHGPVAAVN